MAPLLLLAAAAWSVALGVRWCIALRAPHATERSADPIGEWINALSLIASGAWALQSGSWWALVGGWALGWAALWYAPVTRMPHIRTGVIETRVRASRSV